MGREAFAARLGDVLARDGVVPMDGTALRLLDRVSAVLIDSRVLCAGRPRLMSVTTVGDLGEAEAWSAAQSVLDRRTLRELSDEGPWTRGAWRLERPHDIPAAIPASPLALTADLHDEDGRRQARIRIGCELDPLADAVVAAARTGARHLVLTGHASTDEIAPWADELLPLGASLPDTVRRLQIEGHGVLLISGEDDEALGAADLGVAVTARGEGRVCWSADLICGPGLLHAWRVLRALEERARSAGARPGCRWAVPRSARSSPRREPGPRWPDSPPPRCTARRSWPCSAGSARRAGWSAARPRPASAATGMPWGHGRP
ncbi:Cation-translocating P-type ATPase OS=Streptomyces antimycoticus OX=68175 GN=SSPO_015960 PE=4 SV=1 [Streptomyces antimycoticus]